MEPKTEIAPAKDAPVEEATAVAASTEKEPVKDADPEEKKAEATPVV